MQTLRLQLCIVLAGITLAFTCLGSSSLFDEDEPKNAACGQEMLARGDWIVPTFNTDLRTDKPILLYWFMLLAYQWFGVNEFAARFWSASFAVGTALVIFHLGRKLYNPTVGLWAAIIMLTSLMFDVVARAATPDSTFIFFCTLSLLAYVAFGLKSRSEPGSEGVDSWRDYLPRRWIGFVPMYAAMGLAVLAKGPAGVVLPGSAIGLFLLLVRNRPADGSASGWRARIAATWHLLRTTFAPRRVVEVAWAMRPLTALAVVGAIALPWYIAVTIQTDGAWPAGFLGKHNVGRFVSSMEGHKGPIFYYVIAIAIGFFPWSVFLLPAFQRWRARRIESRNPGDLFLACWAGFYIGFFSLAGTKLPNYVLPAYPALALLTAAMLVEWANRPQLLKKLQAALAFGTLAAVGIGLIIALPIVSYFLLPGEWLLPVAGIVPLAAGIMALRLLKQDRLPQALVVFGIAAMLQSLVLFGFIGPRVARYHTSDALIAEARERAGSAPEIAVFQYFEPSLVYYARDRVDRFTRQEEVQEFFAAGDDHYLITHDRFLPELEGQLPPDVQVLARKRRFLRRGEVLLLGPAREVAQRPGPTAR